MFLKFFFILMLNFLIISKSDAFDLDLSPIFGIFIGFGIISLLKCCVNKYCCSTNNNDRNELDNNLNDTVNNTQQLTNQEDPLPAYDTIYNNQQGKVNQESPPQGYDTLTHQFQDPNSTSLSSYTTCVSTL